MKKIKVLYLTYSLNAGGIEALCVNIIKRINKDKFQIDFVTVKAKNQKQFYDDIVRQCGSKIYAVGDVGKGPIRKYFTTRRDIRYIIKNGEYDVVHVHWGHFDRIPDEFAAKLYGVKKIIIHSHSGGLESSVPFYRTRTILQKCLKHLYPYLATDFFTCSDKASEWAFPKSLIKENRVVQINNGVDVDVFSYSDELREKYRKKLQLNDEFVVGHVGRFTEVKNHTFILDVFYEIHRIEPNSKLLLIGNGPLSNDIRNKISSLNLNDNVIMFGNSTEVFGMMAAMDIFLFPSIYEGLPVSGIEAQAMGLKVFASENISKDVIITNNWITKSLHDTAENWAHDIISQGRNYPRMNMRNDIEKAGFSIEKTVKYLEEVYSCNDSNLE